MLTPNCFFFCSSGSILARWSTHTKISMGSSETEVNEFAVMPWILPGSRSTVTTVTPVEKWPRALRNSDDESGGGGGVVVFFVIIRGRGEGKRRGRRVDERVRGRLEGGSGRGGR